MMSPESCRCHLSPFFLQNNFSKSLLTTRTLVFLQLLEEHLDPLLIQVWKDQINTYYIPPAQFFVISKPPAPNKTSQHQCNAPHKRPTQTMVQESTTTMIIKLISLNKEAGLPGTVHRSRQGSKINQVPPLNLNRNNIWFERVQIWPTLTRCNIVHRHKGNNCRVSTM